MEYIKKKRQSRSGGSGTIDELAIVKAAAWAWYQHGSGSSDQAGKQVSEFDVTRRSQPPKPSRFKLEAINKTMETLLPPHVEDSNSLLDSYEIESISKQLDYFIESSSSRSRFSSGAFDSGELCRQTSMSSTESESTSSAFVKKKKKFPKGFWFGHAAMVCGTREDVDTRAFLVRRRRPERKVPAVRTLFLCHELLNVPNELM